MAWQPDYCEVEDLREFARISHSNDDVRLGLAIAASSRAVDRAAGRGRTPGRQFGVLTVAAARYYTARYDARSARWGVEIDDLMTTTDLVVAVDSDGDETYGTTVTDYSLTPRNAAADGEPWTGLTFGSDVTVPTGNSAVRVTALWGWSAVPPAIEQATLLQASRLLIRRDSPYGVAGSPEAGTEIRLLARLDPDVEVAVAPYRRRRRVVFG
jgi:hypothetical protein